MRPSTVPLLLLALLTVLLTWPLAARATGVGPVNTGDGQWSIWSTCWVARTVAADPLHLYDANIFSPRRGTLAYSEANIAAGVLAMPAWWASRNPYLAYNSAMLLAFFLSSAAAFALARALLAPLSGRGPQGSPLASPSRDAAQQGAALELCALVAAIGFAFAPLVIVRLAHVQLLMTFGLPLSLLALHRFVERQNVLRIVVLACTLVLAALCSGYYGIAAGAAVGLGFLYFAVARGLWRQPRYLAACAAASVLAGLLVLPLLLPYLQLEAGGHAFRSIDETRRYSADWRSYLTSTAHVQRWLLEWIVPFERTAFPERVLFPGLAVSVFAAFAVVHAAKRSRTRVAEASSNPGLRSNPGAPSDSLRETIGFYALLALVGAWLSFGPSAGLYWLAYRFVPGVSLTRAPARLGILVVLALSMLAAMGLAILSQRLRRASASNRSRLAVPALACILLVAETAAVPLDLRPALPIPAVHRTLAALPPGAVAEFPYFYREPDLYRNSLYMLYSTAHWHKLVNGYSDYMPEDYRETVVPISTFPSRDALRLLRERGARYAIVHLNLYDRRSREKLLDGIARYRDYLRPIGDEGDARLYEIVAWPQ